MAQTFAYDWRQELHRQPVCVKCSKSLGEIVRLNVKRNGVFIPYGHDSAQAGDLLSCPVCHTEIVVGFSTVLSKPVSTHVLDSDNAILQGVHDVQVYDQF
jgi:hypothetical protein